MENLLGIREVLLKAVLTQSQSHPACDVLLLKRSKQPDYYEPQRGTALLRGYGAARRALTGYEAFAEACETLGLRVRIFDAGAADLSQQIAAFHHARTVVSIRGAELANMLWMQPGSMVFVINPIEMALISEHRVFAQSLGLSYEEIPSISKFPNLLDFNIPSTLYGHLYQ